LRGEPWLRVLVVTLPETGRYSMIANQNWAWQKIRFHEKTLEAGFDFVKSGL
jgi:hypothetical protein